MNVPDDIGYADDPMVPVLQSDIDLWEQEVEDLTVPLAEVPLWLRVQLDEVERRGAQDG